MNSQVSYQLHICMEAPYGGRIQIFTGIKVFLNINNINKMCILFILLYEGRSFYWRSN